MGIFAGSSPLGVEFSSVRYRDHGHVSSRNCADDLDLGNVLIYSFAIRWGWVHLTNGLPLMTTRYWCGTDKTLSDIRAVTGLLASSRDCRRRNSHKGLSANVRTGSLVLHN
jgi:hypothetical protein